MYLNNTRRSHMDTKHFETNRVFQQLCCNPSTFWLLPSREFLRCLFWFSILAMKDSAVEISAIRCNLVSFLLSSDTATCLHRCINLKVPLDPSLESEHQNEGNWCLPNVTKSACIQHCTDAQELKRGVAALSILKHLFLYHFWKF